MEDLKKSGRISDPLNCVYEITQIHKIFKKSPQYAHPQIQSLTFHYLAPSLFMKATYP